MAERLAPDAQAHADAIDTAAGALSGGFGDELWAILGIDLQPWPPSDRGLPIAPLVLASSRSSNVYVVTAMDSCGRLAARLPLRALGWGSGLRVAVTVRSGAIVVVARPDGAQAITDHGHLRLPVAVRRRYRLEDGDRLLVMACPNPSVLVAYTTAMVDAMVLAYHVRLAGEAS